MKKILAFIFITLFCSHTSFANERGTQDEAEALVKKAAAYLEANGAVKAFEAFQEKNGAFRMKDLYVFVQDFECNFLAHGLNPRLVGKNIWNLKNPNGRYACQDIVKATKSDGEAWTDYIFVDPVSGQLADKTTYSLAVGEYIVMSGFYQ